MRAAWDSLPRPPHCTRTHARTYTQPTLAALSLPPRSPSLVLATMIPMFQQWTGINAIMCVCYRSWLGGGVVSAVRVAGFLPAPAVMWPPSNATHPHPPTHPPARTPLPHAQVLRASALLITGLWQVCRTAKRSHHWRCQLGGHLCVHHAGGSQRPPHPVHGGGRADDAGAGARGRCGRGGEEMGGGRAPTTRCRQQALRRRRARLRTLPPSLAPPFLTPHPSHPHRLRWALPWASASTPTTPPPSPTLSPTSPSSSSASLWQGLPGEQALVGQGVGRGREGGQAGSRAGSCCILSRASTSPNRPPTHPQVVGPPGLAGAL